MKRRLHLIVLTVHPPPHSFCPPPLSLSLALSTSFLCPPHLSYLPLSPLRGCSSTVTWPVGSVSCYSQKSESTRLAAHSDRMITLFIITVRS